MPVSRLLTLVPALGGLRVDTIARSEHGIVLAVSATRRTARCPLCGRRSKRIHSTYARTLRDLPWSGTPITLQVVVRRFRCGKASCPRRIFAERFPDLVTPYARQTSRWRDALRAIGFALGGTAGARLAGK